MFFLPAIFALHRAQQHARFVVVVALSDASDPTVLSPPRREPTHRTEPPRSLAENG